MRKLVSVVTDQAVTVFERVPGPYSHSSTLDMIIFAMTAEESDAMEVRDERTVKPQATAPASPSKEKGAKGQGAKDPQVPITDPAAIEQALTDTTPATDLPPATPVQTAPESKKK